MPTPLMTYELYSYFIAAAAVNDHTKKETIVSVLNLLPDSNRMILEKTVLFLHKVSLRSSENMMTPANLAVCIGFSLLRPENDDPLIIVSDAKMCCELFQMLIQDPSIFTLTNDYETINIENTSQNGKMTSRKSSSDKMGSSTDTLSGMVSPRPNNNIAASKISASRTLTKNSMGKKVFIVHLSEYDKKAVLLDPLKPLRQVVQKVCDARDLVYDEFEAIDLNDNFVDMNTLLGNIPGMEIILKRKEGLPPLDISKIKAPSSGSVPLSPIPSQSMLPDYADSPMGDRFASPQDSHGRLLFSRGINPQPIAQPNFSDDQEDSIPLPPSDIPPPPSDPSSRAAPPSHPPPSPPKRNPKRNSSNIDDPSIYENHSSLEPPPLPQSPPPQPHKYTASSLSTTQKVNIPSSDDTSQSVLASEPDVNHAQLNTAKSTTKLRPLPPFPRIVPGKNAESKKKFQNYSTSADSSLDDSDQTYDNSKAATHGSDSDSDQKGTPNQPRRSLSINNESYTHSAPEIQSLDKVVSPPPINSSAPNTTENSDTLESSDSASEKSSKSKSTTALSEAHIRAKSTLGGGERCVICNKLVYAVEIHFHNKQVYHALCFRRSQQQSVSVKRVNIAAVNEGNESGRPISPKVDTAELKRKLDERYKLHRSESKNQLLKMKQTYNIVNETFEQKLAIISAKLKLGELAIEEEEEEEEEEDESNNNVHENNEDVTPTHSTEVSETSSLSTSLVTSKSHRPPPTRSMTTSSSRSSNTQDVEDSSTSSSSSVNNTNLLSTNSNKAQPPVRLQVNDVDAESSSGNEPATPTSYAKKLTSHTRSNTLPSRAKKPAKFAKETDSANLSSSNTNPPGSLSSQKSSGKLSISDGNISIGETSNEDDTNNINAALLNEGKFMSRSTGAPVDTKTPTKKKRSKRTVSDGTDLTSVSKSSSSSIFTTLSPKRKKNFSVSSAHHNHHHNHTSVPPPSPHPSSHTDESSDLSVEVPPSWITVHFAGKKKSKKKKEKKT
eukprot:TRINITY_DN3108_c0_g1_i1.p1 TRINITY_DN3108_c0_g1~~TRINITY_DN3108_c0_g1_i1.p1  ORF type:complete len:1005 (-),score=258.80 TRINITY_DN3108_c0_g1_i1:132-3146(-)